MSAQNIANTCVFIAKEYGVQPGTSWGTLSDRKLRTWWNQNGCNSVVKASAPAAGAPALNAGAVSGGTASLVTATGTQPTHSRVYLDSWAGVSRPDLLREADRVMFAFWGLTDAGAVTGRDNGVEQALAAAKVPHVSAALGGWGNCANFSALFADPAKRATVVGNIVAACAQAGFDGLDVDWEYPSTAGDPANLLAFLVALRAAAPAGFHISIAGVSDPSSYYSSIASGLAAAVDAVHIMTYDYVGPWDSTAGFNSSLPDAQSSVSQYATLGFPVAKLFVGAAFYGREATVNSVSLNFGIGQKAVAWKELKYSEIAATRLGQPGWIEVWVDGRKSPWLYNPSQLHVLTYEDAQAIAAKRTWALDAGLGGVMCWAWNQDDAAGTLGKALIGVN